MYLGDSTRESSAKLFMIVHANTAAKIIKAEQDALASSLLRLYSATLGNLQQARAGALRSTDASCQI